MNNYGKRLLEVCKSFNLSIANGRLGRDKSLDKKPCKGSSVIDYVILSPLLFIAVKDFEILPFEPLVSDARSTTSITGQLEIDNEDITVIKANWNSEANGDN